MARVGGGRPQCTLPWSLASVHHDGVSPRLALTTVGMPHDGGIHLLLSLSLPSPSLVVSHAHLDHTHSHPSTANAPAEGRLTPDPTTNWRWLMLNYASAALPGVTKASLGGC